MNATTILSLITALVPLISQISSAWNTSTGSSLQKIGQVITSSAGTELQNFLANVGGALFPKLDSSLHAAAAALIAAEHATGAVAWVQAALNILQSNGEVSFNGQGTYAAGSTTQGTNSPLTVDGIFGPKTQAAILALQAKFGLPTTGMFADTEVSILQAATQSGNTQTLQSFLQGLLSKI